MNRSTLIPPCLRFCEKWASLLNLTAIFLVLSTSQLRAELKLGPLFKDNVVIQRNQPICVWGWDAPNQRIRVSLADNSAETIADNQGYWLVLLDPMEASSAPLPMTITGTETITLDGVLVGEVWLASGQSNMQLPVRLAKDEDVEKLTARWPLIREIKIEQNVSDTPTHTANTSKWREAMPENIDTFSATAYYFARDLHSVLGVPIGIINATWGGTRIEAWIDPETAHANNGEPFATIHREWNEVLAAYPEAQRRYEEQLNAWQEQRNAHIKQGKKFTERRPQPPQGPGHQATPSGLYNAMIHPITPYTFAGIIWYQGEANTSAPDAYKVLFPAMIEGWRHAFGQADLPFYWVQLASYRGGRKSQDWPALREAQAAALSLPKTGQAIAIDIGDTTNIHPTNKQDVGRRLARLALNRTYGVELVDRGPVVGRIEREGNGFRVHFTESHRGLKTPSGTCSGFELAGGDGVFHPAEAKVQGNTVFVSSTRVSAPTSIRYAWHNAPNPGLYNGYDLPAEPFCIDDKP